MASDTFRELCALMLHAWEKGYDIVGAMNRARATLDADPAPPPLQPPGRCGMTWSDAIQGLRDVLADDSQDAVQKPWQRSRILDAVELMETNALDVAPAPAGGPSDEDLLTLLPEQFHADLATVCRMAAHGAPTEVGPGIFRVSLNTGAVDFARGVLARFGTAPPPAADGEVAELVATLRRKATQNPMGITDPTITRAADLLERQQPRPSLPPRVGHILRLAEIIRAVDASHDALCSPSLSAEDLAEAILSHLDAGMVFARPRPVAVKERPWEREGWCDAEGRCWFGTPSEPLDSADFTWRKCKPRERMHATVALPHDALPLPEAAP